MYNLLPMSITECMRCGTCCLKGGPVLHHEDKKVLLSGQAGHQHLITIRKGEMAFDPVKGRLEPVKKELIKVRGKGDDWHCYFYDEKKASCQIYDHRFLECRLLKCWDTSDVISVIGKNTLLRSGIINPGDPVLEVIDKHEQECSFHEINKLIFRLNSGGDKSEIIAQLAGFVRKDISIRSFAISELGIKAEFELFIFGRPLLQILNDHRIPVHI